MSRNSLIRERQSEVRALQKESYELRRAYWSREWIPLDKPIRNGWWKHLQIKKPIAETKNGVLFSAICEMVTLKVGGIQKEECDKRWKRTLKRNRHIRLPGIQGINKRDMKKLPPAARKYFLYYGRNLGYRDERVFMCMLSQSYFEEAYSRAYTTHILPVDSEVIQRIDEIDELLLSDKYYRYARYESNYHDWNYENRHKRERQTVRLELNEKIKFQNSVAHRNIKRLSNLHTAEPAS